VRLEYKECAGCATKSCAPVLCRVCQHNRAAVDRLNELVARAIVIVEALRATAYPRVAAGTDWLREAKKSMGVVHLEPR
jgi:hypothetical protein